MVEIGSIIKKQGIYGICKVLVPFKGILTLWLLGNFKNIQVEVESCSVNFKGFSHGSPPRFHI